LQRGGSAGDGFAQGLFGFGGANGMVFLLNAGNGVEEQLREVTDGERVATVNALASELFDVRTATCASRPSGTKLP
jgi:hypothetical protein